MAIVHRRSRPAVPGEAPAAARPAAQADPGAREWFGAARSARIRIVASFLVVLVVSGAGSLIAIRQVLLLRLDHRIDGALEQEARELDRLLEDGRDPRTGGPFNSLSDFFEVYFARNVPGPEEGMLAFVGGRLERSRTARLAVPELPIPVVDRWAEMSNSLSPLRSDLDVTGRYDTAAGEARYRISPVRYDDGTGAFVVTILPSAELREIRGLQTWGALVMFGVLMVAAACTWFVAGRALAPVRQLTATARAISESDVTSRVEVRGQDEAAEMARSFNAMLDRLEAVFRDERQFVRDASHELRDPLTICLGYLRQLDSVPPAERAEVLRIVGDELVRMGRIVDDLQGLAEAEHPDFLRPEPIDLDLLAHDLVAKAAGLAERRWTLLGGEPGVVVADRERLTEAVMNLARNAVEHTAADDEIAIGVIRSGSEVRLSVRDDGDGIPAAEQDRIFERLVRGEGGRRRYRGSGLGLAIVRLIAEAHGGRVEVRSRVGHGSTFTIVIPAVGPGEGDG